MRAKGGAGSPGRWYDLASPKAARIIEVSMTSLHQGPSKKNYKCDMEGEVGVVGIIPFFSTRSASVFRIYNSQPI